MVFNLGEKIRIPKSHFRKGYFFRNDCFSPEENEFKYIYGNMGQRQRVTNCVQVSLEIFADFANQ